MAVSFVANLAPEPKAGDRFIHPGAPTYPRIAEIESTAPPWELRIVIPAGTNVGTALRRALAISGAASGCGRIAGGTLSSLAYHVIVKARDGQKPFVYGAPIECHGDLTLVAATITLGRTVDGTQIIHCHGGFIDLDGRQHGGHVVLDRSVAGAHGLVLRLCLFAQTEFVLRTDHETTFDLLSPMLKG
jgi:hypothetical protein